MEPGTETRAQTGPETGATAETTRERIASAALAILTEEGASAVTMRRVAAAAGVTPMATYRHYPSRGALLDAVADTVSEELGRDWRKRSESGDFESRIDALLDAFLDFALGKPTLYMFLMTDRREGARRFPGDFRGGGSPTFTPVVRAVEQGLAEGELRVDGDPLEATLAITAHGMGLVQLYLGGRIGCSEEEFRALCKRSVGRVLNGFRVRSGT
jgi:AcrR family transcriptional regulator